MNTKAGTPESAPVTFETQRKDTEFSQIQLCQLAFFDKPRTMMQAEMKSGVRREYICRYVKIMREAGAIWIVNVGRCPITKHSKVQYLTTNPQLVESLPQQLKLF